MKILFDVNHYSYNIVIEAENVRIIEDVQERIYSKTEDGKTDFGKSPKRDVTDDALNMICQVLSDMLDIRDKPYNSTSLILSLSDKLSDNQIQDLIKTLNDQYGDEEL